MLLLAIEEDEALERTMLLPLALAFAADAADHTRTPFSDTHAPSRKTEERSTNA